MLKKTIGVAWVCGGFLVSAANAGVDWDLKIRTQLLESTAPVSALSVTTAPAGHLPRRDLTSVLGAARAHWDELSDDTKRVASTYLQRPYPPGAVVNEPGFSELSWAYGNVTETTIVSSSGAFRIHYINKADYPTNPKAATTSFATTVATIIDEANATETGTLAYTAVPSDASATYNGGDGKFDVYLTNLGPYGLYGYVAPDSANSDNTRPYGQYSYMVLDNDYSIGEYGYVDTSLPLKVTVAHEYFHAIQFGYSAQEFGSGAAFMEQSATWMEDIVYPAIHDNYYYIGEPYTDANSNGQYDVGEAFVDRNANSIRDSGSADYPEAALDAFDDVPTIQYGRFVWFHYLTEKHGNGIVKTIFEKCGQVAGDNLLSAISQALQENGSSLAAGFQEYATWNYDLSKYADGANYPLVYVDRVISGASANANSIDSPSLALWSGFGYPTQLHLSTIYTRMNNPTGTYEFITAGGSPAITMLVGSGGGTFTSQQIALSSGVGSWTAPGGTTLAIAVVSNVAPTTDNMVWNIRPSGTVSNATPALKDVRISGSATTVSWSGGSASVSGTAGKTLAFTVSGTDADGTTPVFEVLSNNSGGIFDSTSNTYTWDSRVVAGTYTLQLRARDKYDVRQYVDGAITISIAAATTSKSKDKGFLGLGAFGAADALLLAFALGLTRRRRIAARYGL